MSRCCSSIVCLMASKPVCRAGAMLSRENVCKHWMVWCDCHPDKVNLTLNEFEVDVTLFLFQRLHSYSSEYRILSGGWWRPNCIHASALTHIGYLQLQHWCFVRLVDMKVCHGIKHDRRPNWLYTFWRYDDRMFHTFWRHDVLVDVIT